MVKFFITGAFVLLFAGASFAQSPTLSATADKALTHSLVVNSLQTEADTVGISDVFDRCTDRISSISYDVPTSRVIIRSESLRTEDIMEMLFMKGYTSYCIKGNKKITMLSSGKMETTDVK